MPDTLGWTRKEFTTPGPDPTVVVRWTKGDVVLTEFQGIYDLRAPFSTELTSLAEDLHRALEHIHWMQSNPPEPGDVEDPDHGIYGEP